MVLTYLGNLRSANRATMITDLSFITNEENQNLKERFEVLIKDTALFDCLVGYFYSSGFHAITVTAIEYLQSRYGSRGFTSKSSRGVDHRAQCF